jgi:tetratricopeptide (TPR) repeat protein
MMGFYAFIRGGDAWPKAKAAANRAIQLDPTIGDAHVALSLLALQFDRDFQRGVSQAEEAVRLNPDLAIGWHGLSIALNTSGRSEEALVAVRKAAELDPLTPLFQAHVAWTLHCAGRTDEAWQQLRSALEVHPNDYYINRILMYCADTPERCKVALTIGERIATLGKNKTLAQGMLGVIAARMGERDRAREIARRLEEQAASDPSLGYWLAFILAALGENLDIAVQWLERAEQGGLGILIIVGCEPSFSPLWPLPRFQALLHKLGRT